MELSTSDLIRKSLHGEWSHPDPAKALDGVDWKKAGEKIPNLPYSIWQLFCHVEYWQRLILQGLKGETVTWPENLENSWHTSHTAKSEQEFQQLVTEFNQQLTEIESILNENMLTEDFPGGDGMNKAEFLRVLITHNSYHFGQIIVLKRLLSTM